MMSPCTGLKVSADSMDSSAVRRPPPSAVSVRQRSIFRLGCVPLTVMGEPFAGGSIQIALVAGGDEGALAEEEGEEGEVGEEDDAAEEVSFEGPHAASASPAVTSKRAAGAPRRMFLMRMVFLFPLCRQ